MLVRNRPSQYFTHGNPSHRCEITNNTELLCFPGLDSEWSHKQNGLALFSISDYYINSVSFLFLSISYMPHSLSLQLWTANIFFLCILSYWLPMSAALERVNSRNIFPFALSKGLLFTGPVVLGAKMLAIYEEGFPQRISMFAKTGSNWRAPLYSFPNFTQWGNDGS